MSHGRHTARVMVIGQAPGVRTMRAGIPFSGPGGKLLRQWIARGGIPLERQEELVYLTSLTKCFPGPALTGSGDRKPSPREVELCSRYLNRELRILDPSLALLVGGMSIERVLGKARLDSVVGRLFEHDGRAWLPLPHPSGVSRWLNDPAHKLLVEDALTEMRKCVRRKKLLTSVDDDT